MSTLSRVMTIIAALGICFMLMLAGALYFLLAQPQPGTWSSSTVKLIDGPVCGTWTLFTPSGFLPGNSELVSIKAISDDDVWAVGYTSNGWGTYRPLMMHWDGNHWSRIAVPRPQSQEGLLKGVAATGPRDVWVVGREGDNALILHWDGESWNANKGLPAPTPNSRYKLNSVIALSKNDVWAVGSYGTIGPASIEYALIQEKTLTLHWDGTSWSLIPSPNAGYTGNQLQSVAAVSSGDVWAVGYYSGTTGIETMMLHWDGHGWDVVSIPEDRTSELDNWFSHLDGVAAPGPRDLWAVGGSSSRSAKTLLMRGNGVDWSLSPSSISDTELTAVSARDSRDVWAVGMQGMFESGHTFVQHWDGSTWSAVPGPNTRPKQGFWSVAISPSGGVWASGHSGDQAMVAHFATAPCTPSAP